MLSNSAEAVSGDSAASPRLQDPGQRKHRPAGLRHLEALEIEIGE
jgi:hypothetical protein